MMMIMIGWAVSFFLGGVAVVSRSCGGRASAASEFFEKHETHTRACAHNISTTTGTLPPHTHYHPHTPTRTTTTQQHQATAHLRAAVVHDAEDGVELDAREAELGAAVRQRARQVRARRLFGLGFWVLVFLVFWFLVFGGLCVFWCFFCVFLGVVCLFVCLRARDVWGRRKRVVLFFPKKDDVVLREHSCAVCADLRAHHRHEDTETA
jgi:hypothetical protein